MSLTARPGLVSHGRQGPAWNVVDGRRWCGQSMTGGGGVWVVVDGSVGRGGVGIVKVTAGLDAVRFVEAGLGWVGLARR